MKKKMVFITTIPESLSFFKGQLRFLNQYFEVEAVSSGGDNLNDIKNNEGITVKSIQMRREISPLKDLLSLFCFIRYFYCKKPFIIHANTPKASMLSLIAAFLVRVPHRIYMCHGLRYQSSQGIMRRLLMTMEKISCLCATKIYAVSDGVASMLAADKITAKKISVVMGGSANGIDLNYYTSSVVSDLNEYRQHLGIRENDFVFVFLGRVVQNKGINELLEVFVKLRVKYGNIKLIVGGPHEKSDPISFDSIRELQNNPAILYLGLQKDVRPFLALSHCLVLPSYREGLGMVLLEAGAMQVACIASDIVGCNNVIQNEINGLLIKPRDVDSLYTAMERMYHNNELRSQIIQAMKIFVCERFDQQKIWDAFLKEYLSLK